MNKNLILGLLVFGVSSVLLFVGSKQRNIAGVEETPTPTVTAKRTAQEIELFQEVEGGKPFSAFKLAVTYPSDLTPAINNTKTRATFSKKDFSLSLFTQTDSSSGIFYQLPDYKQLEKSPLDRPVFRVKFQEKENYYYTDLFKTDDFSSCEAQGFKGDYKACSGEGILVVQGDKSRLLFINCTTTNTSLLDTCDEIVSSLHIQPGN